MRCIAPLRRTRIASLAVLAVLAVPLSGAAATTLENLQTAYNGEQNAHSRYLAFARQADTEGYGQVASLFRAAARAEEVHAANHAKVIKQMGGDPTARIETPTVKTTRENLEAAIKGETYEKDTMYPEFLKQARAQGNVQATKTFNLAKTAEEEHAKLFSAALAGLDKSKGSSGTAYYVCPTCGFTTAAVDFPKCPSCFSPKEKFEQVI